MITLLLVLGAICFLVAVIGHFVPGIGAFPWVPLGLLFWILTALLPALGVNG